MDSKTKMTIFIGATLWLLSILIQFTAASPADSLPAFKSDSASADRFRQLERGGFSSGGIAPSGASPTVAQSDTGKVHFDSVTSMLRKRKLALTVYFGVDFFDFDGKEQFQNSLNTRISGDTTLSTLQPYENVHLAFPLGLQINVPIQTYLDLVLKTHSYWYQQTAILGNKTTKAHVADESYNVQGNLGGLGLRYYLPPAFISVSGQMTLYAQTVWYWNLGNSEIYSNYGSASANFDPTGSGFEIQLGYLQPLTKAWQITNSLGFIHQSFDSDTEWKNVVEYAPQAGKAHWGSSGIQANISLEYHFGIPNAVNSSPTN